MYLFGIIVITWICCFVLGMAVKSALDDYHHGLLDRMRQKREQQETLNAYKKLLKK